MAKKSTIQKQLKRENLIKRYFDKRQALKKVVSDVNVSDEERQQAMLSLSKLPKNSSPIRSRNRCQLTGRPRGFLRKFKLSRLCFRELANAGYIPGVVKASW
ncbi:MAG: 30S ribosomal protein S14 [Chlamydiae bacterium]|jgi:small subunit ribosomal protein S14|nr:30S ribosomal protein S14 [Chlamydiota bacterium]